MVDLPVNDFVVNQLLGLRCWPYQSIRACHRPAVLAITVLYSVLLNSGVGHTSLLEREIGHEDAGHSVNFNFGPLVCGVDHINATGLCNVANTGQ